MARRRTTLKDVAEAVGVHVSTVSRALNPATRHFIRPEVASRIAEVSAELNYQPNVAAYSLRTNRTRIVGITIPDIADPVFPPIIRGIEAVLGEAGYMGVLVNVDGHPGGHASQLEMLAARGVDGLIVSSVELDDETVPQMAAEGLPLVTVNRRSSDPAVPSVTNDEDMGLGLILEHLHALGHRRVAHIGGPQHISTAKGRHDGFERHRRRLGLDADPALVVLAGALTESEGERCAGLLLEQVRGITAIAAANDRLAVGLLGVLKGRGIACPHEMSLTGYNDMPIVDRLEPPLTTVRVQQYEVGRRAAQMLLDEIEGRAPGEPQHVVMPVELIVRGSTGPAQARV